MGNKKLDKSPAFQFYPDKWESHTAHLSDYAYRIYHRIICWMWQHSEDKCSIQANDAAIAIVLAQPCERITDAMREINNMHMPLLKKRGNRWLSGGLQKEAKKQKERRKKAQDSAKARWDKDLGNDKKGSKRNANASIEHSSPSPSPSPIPITINKDKSTHDRLLEIFKKEIPSLPKPGRKSAGSREKALLARFKDLDQDFDAWQKLCARIESSDFLAGRTDNQFSCGIDWVLKPANFAKITEGNYDNKTNRGNNGRSTQNPQRKTGYITATDNPENDWDAVVKKQRSENVQGK